MSGTKSILWCASSRSNLLLQVGLLTRGLCAGCNGSMELKSSVRTTVADQSFASALHNGRDKLLGRPRLGAGERSGEGKIRSYACKIGVAAGSSRCIFVSMLLSKPVNARKDPSNVAMHTQQPHPVKLRTSQQLSRI